MAVISITITDSTFQILAGIPKQVTIEVSTPSTVFYTFDGAEPDVNSSIYINSLLLPTNSSAVTLKLFATNGSDSSAIITKSWSSSFTGLKQAHDKVINAQLTSSERNNMFPFGGISAVVPPQFGNTAGTTVDSNDIVNIHDGYDGTATGTSTGGTDLPLEDYEMIYSTTNETGEIGHGIGTLPAKVLVRLPTTESTSGSNNINSRFFNPRSMVIYQDSRDIPIDPDAPQLNKQFFSMDNAEVVKNGVHYFNNSLDNMQPTGAFVKAHFNSRDQTTTYYYRDRETNRWVISKEPYTPGPTNTLNLSQMVWGRGGRNVYKWITFKGSRYG